MFEFSVPVSLVVQFLIAFFLPLVVALVTEKVTAPHVKALVLIGLSILSSGLVEFGAALAANTPFDIGLFILTALGSFITGAGAHFGLWKGTPVQESLQAR